MYEEDKTPELYKHCQRIGIEPDLYLELIHSKYKTMDDYREHISELEQITNEMEDSD